MIYTSDEDVLKTCRRKAHAERDPNGNEDRSTVDQRYDERSEELTEKVDTTETGIETLTSRLVGFCNDHDLLHALAK